MFTCISLPSLFARGVKRLEGVFKRSQTVLKILTYLNQMHRYQTRYSVLELALPTRGSFNVYAFERNINCIKQDFGVIVLLLYSSLFICCSTKKVGTVSSFSSLKGMHECTVDCVNRCIEYMRYSIMRMCRND